MESQSAGIYWAPTMCLSVRNAAGKKQWLLPAEACLGNPIRVVRAVRRGKSPQEGIDPPDRHRALHEGSKAQAGRSRLFAGAAGGQHPDQSQGRVCVPTGVLGVECGAGRAPLSTPWAPGLWPPPHGPMSLAAVFIPSSGPFGPPW